MTEEDINGVFEEFGEVQHIRINQGNRADSKNGFGFVTFKSEESVKNALEKKVSLLLYVLWLKFNVISYLNF